MSLEIIGLRECRPPTSRSESDLNTEFGPTRLGSVQRGSSGGAVPSPAVSQYSDELRRPAWRLQGSHSAKNPAPQNLGQAHVCARPARNDRRSVDTVGFAVSWWSRLDCVGTSRQFP